VSVSGPGIHELPDALDRFDEIAQTLSGGTPVVFLDYDGTLTPIVETPEAAVLDTPTRDTLEHVAAVFPLVVVSGRDLDDVMWLAAVAGAWYAGSHGFDIAGPGGFRFQHPEAERALGALDAAAGRLELGLSGIEGAQVERKHFAVAVHYRRVAPADVDRVMEAFDAVATEAPLRRSAGKMVLELRPDVDWHKGAAVRWLLDDVLPRPHGVPLYIGDDLTDEDAFAEIRGDGVGIAVHGSGHATAARYSLRDPAAVRAFLERVVALHEEASH
jgi:trehalose-phosphatase